jgi:hypothetical protein
LARHPSAATNVEKVLFVAVCRTGTFGRLVYKIGVNGTARLVAPAPPMPIRQFLQGTSFEPEAVEAMGEAFDSAWRVVRHSRIPTTQQALAEKIIAAAARGERDPERLRDIALRDFGLHR